MNEPDKVDLSPLDPSVDGPHWQALIHSISARARARQRPFSVARQLVAWAPRTLAAAAGLALAVWLGAWRAGGTNQAAQVAEPDSATLLSQWAVQDETPSIGQIFAILGGSHGR